MKNIFLGVFQSFKKFLKIGGFVNEKKQSPEKGDLIFIKTIFNNTFVVIFQEFGTVKTNKRYFYGHDLTGVTDNNYPWLFLKIVKISENTWRCLN